jgi:hypothetical protein
MNHQTYKFHRWILVFASFLCACDEKPSRYEIFMSRDPFPEGTAVEEFPYETYQTQRTSAKTGDLYNVSEFSLERIFFVSDGKNTVTVSTSGHSNHEEGVYITLGELNLYARYEIISNSNFLLHDDKILFAFGGYLFELSKDAKELKRAERLFPRQSYMFAEGIYEDSKGVFAIGYSSEPSNPYSEGSSYVPLQIDEKNFKIGEPKEFSSIVGKRYLENPDVLYEESVDTCLEGGSYSYLFIAGKYAKFSPSKMTLEFDNYGYRGKAVLGEDSILSYDAFQYAKSGQGFSIYPHHVFGTDEEACAFSTYLDGGGPIILFAKIDCLYLLNQDYLSFSYYPLPRHFQYKVALGKIAKDYSFTHKTIFEESHFAGFYLSDDAFRLEISYEATSSSAKGGKKLFGSFTL